MKLIIFTTLSAIIVLFSSIFNARKAALPLTIMALLIGLGMVFQYNCQCDGSFDRSFIDESVYKNMISFNRFSAVYSGIMVFSTLLIIILSANSIKPIFDHYRSDIYGLMLFTLCGAFMLVSYQHLVMLFLGIEILSIPLYVLAGSRKNDLASNEAAFKYFLMGSFTTGILLFGIALIYGSTASFDLNVITTYAHVGHLSTMFKLGMIMMLAGMAFKIGLVPFHFWSPDVYSGSPSVITAFMATVVKTSVFGAAYILFSRVFGVNAGWTDTLALIAVATMFVGNLTATRQTTFKRMMAYSSIAHAGYVLIAMVSPDLASGKAVILYMAAYSLATIGAFAVMMAIKRCKGTDELTSFSGLGQSNPFLATALTICLMSLAGIPLTAGFISKYYLFSTGWSGYSWLIIVAIVNSAISIYYYFKPVINMWFKPSEDQIEVSSHSSLKLVLWICIIGIFAIGVYPDLLLMFAE
ncbi:MAG: NADH-quinone oxidoreductase subunit N [Bacteroidetes bacterium]|nr:NADH-quinone oxidoreductase subunit N [Bacteroidota bacterium]